MPEPTKDLQIANMYRRLQKVVTHIILAFSLKKKKKNLLLLFHLILSWHYCKLDAQIILFEEFRLHSQMHSYA